MQKTEETREGDIIEAPNPSKRLQETVSTLTTPKDAATIEYSFGSEADLQAATNINFSLIDEIRRARHDRAIVVLNFRALQARRIDEMQEDLLALSKSKVEMLQESPGPAEALELERYRNDVLRINPQIDELLHKYGMHSFSFSVIRAEFGFL